MSRLPPLLLVMAVWAAIYLPALGSFEIRGEEGRRILPAIAMLQSGNYLVPEVGGEPYFRKPPLINWLIAASFNLSHLRNEWAARAPSVFAVLLVAIAFVTVAKNSLGPLGSTIAALVWLTNVGMMQKGRLIEIEALYVSLSALAVICWLAWWQQERSRWLTWVVPWILLGLGLLAKGPANLVFFYAVVLAVVWKSRNWRSLIHPAHLLGVIVMLAIFAAWAIPLLQASSHSPVLHKWSTQFSGRVTGEFFSFWPWISNVPKSLGYFLPWLLLVPFVRFQKFNVPAEREFARALLWSAAVPLIVVGLIPGGAPRYSLPALTPFCWFMAMALRHDAFVQPKWLPLRIQPVWPRFGRAFVILAVVFGLAAFPIMAAVMKHRPKVKNIAAEINRAVPAQETLYAVDPNYQPFFFYMRAPVKYVSTVEEVPYDAHFFLIRPHDEQTAVTSRQWAPRHAEQILRVRDYRKQSLVLFRLEPDR
jgi:4-amino-4-deoxy-L-arabinose transferase-like glycosyltransferase